MSSETATSAAAARVLADQAGDPGASLAGLIGVLDRVDGVGAHQRARARRPSAAQTDAYRRGTVRRAPLRSVPPAPPARPALADPVRATPPAPAAAETGRLQTLVRRAAHWGAGADGEYLAWRTRSPRPAPRAPAVPLRSAARAVVPPPSAARAGVVPRRPSLLRGLICRIALWGAGTDGEHLAWTSARSSARGPGRTVPTYSGRMPIHSSRRDADRPVVLREMPSTPLIQPAASSPAAALIPSGPASSAGPRGARPVPSGAVPVPGIRPRGRTEPSRATGWPSAARLTSAATGLVRARGDPLACPVRGSPPPVRRARSPGSARSSFPPGPVLRSGTGAFRI